MTKLLINDLFSLGFQVSTFTLSNHLRQPRIPHFTPSSHRSHRWYIRVSQIHSYLVRGVLRALHVCDKNCTLFPLSLLTTKQRDRKRLMKADTTRWVVLFLTLTARLGLGHEDDDGYIRVRYFSQPFFTRQFPVGEISNFLRRPRLFAIHFKYE